MQMNISGHHVELTEALRNHVNQKFEKLGRHFSQITQAHVTLEVTKTRQKAEATIHVAGADLFADAESPDMYASIDQITEKLNRQLIKHKEKMNNHR